MEKKETWDSLPREILGLIVHYCGRDCSQVKWMFSNKKWFTFYLSQVFNNIFIDLDINDKKINKILFSSFDPGKWVKCITFNRFKLPKNRDQFVDRLNSIAYDNSLNMFDDTLVILIKRTPNVEEIQFSRLKDLDNTAWIYLYLVLLETSFWKLQILPEKERDKLAYSPFYYLCAYRMRCTLKKLYLSCGMIGALDFESLRGFKALEDLYVDTNILGNLNGLYSLLQYVPNLKEVTVNFSYMSFNRFLNRSFEQTNHIYSNIKKLTLYNYIPQYIKELSVFIEKFTRLNELRITSNKYMQWPSTIDTVNSSMIDVFIGIINSISEYEITVPRGTVGANFISQWLKLMEESNQKIRLSMVYVKENSLRLLEIGRGASVTAKSSKCSSISTLQHQMVYSVSNKYEEIEVLNDTIDKALQVEITGNPKPELLLRTIVEKDQPNLKTLIVKNSTFISYVSPINTTTVSQHIRSIVFCNCFINLNTVKLFLNKFNTLDYVSFDGCSSGEMPNVDWSNQWISMPNTTVGTMHLSNIRKMFGWQNDYLKIPNIVIIRVNFNDTRDKCYALIENNIIEITFNLFTVYRAKFKREEMIVIKIRVYSIKELSLKLMDSSKELKIKFSR